MRREIDLNVSLGLEDLEESDVEDIVGNEQKIEFESINLYGVHVPKIENEPGKNISIDLNISDDDEKMFENVLDDSPENDLYDLNTSEEEDNKSEPLGNEIEKRLEIRSTAPDLDHVFLLYCEYARFMGFSVRKGYQWYFGQTQEICWKEFQCSCTGFPDCRRSSGRVARYNKQITRTNCKAKLRVSRIRHGPWKVTSFEKVHNHDLVPADQSYLLRSACDLSHAKRSVLEAMHSVGIGVSRACRFMEKECGGPQNVRFTRKDVYAHMEKIKKETRVENVDANALMHILLNSLTTSPSFIGMFN